MEEEKLIRACVKYFKNTSGFNRVFEKIRAKYKSLGTLGGTIVLTNLKEEEKEALTGLFRKDYYKKSASFKVEVFIKALENTKFSGVNFDELLEEYFGEALLSNKEEKNIYDEEKDEYFNDIIKVFQGTRAEKWLQYLMESKENAYRTLGQKYDEDKRFLKDIISDVCRAYNDLSFDKNNTVRLALLSSMITKNPHSFDDNTDSGKLLVYAIQFYLGLPSVENAEELSELLYKAGIIRDEVSNFTLCSGILGYDLNGIHEGWKGFYEASEPLQVSLWNISKINRVVSPQNKVYVFENPTVFSEVLYKTSFMKPSLICTFGNFKLASLILMDKLVDSGATIYYSGDFDPEGVIMADKLKQRYGDSLIVWRYDDENYHYIKSFVKLSETRIKKLENVKSEELEKIVMVLKNHRLAAYQEMLIDKYVEDVVNNVNMFIDNS